MNVQQKATLQKLGPFLALLVLVAGLAITSQDFLTTGNLLNVFRQVSINALIAFGMTLVILLGGIDLSVGSILALSSVLTALMLSHGIDPIVATSVGVLAGAGMGMLNGLVISKGKVAPFIATLGMMTILRGLALVFSDGRPISGLDSDFFAMLGGGYVGGIIPVPVIIMLVMFGIFWFVLKNTVFGRHVYAVGGNEEASRLSGINTDRIKIWVYTLSGAMAATAGMILTSRLNSAQPTAGTGYELDAIAAVVLGGGYVGGIIPVPVIIMLVMFGIFWFVLKNTVFGRHVYAVGGNEEASRLSGINTDRIKIWVYTLSGAMAATAGMILTSRLNSAQPTAGTGYELDAIAAVVLGGTSLTGGRGWIFGTLVGALLIGILNNGLNLLGVSSFYQQVIKGVVILLAVLLDRANKNK